MQEKLKNLVLRLLSWAFSAKSMRGLTVGELKLDPKAQEASRAEWERRVAAGPYVTVSSTRPQLGQE